MAAEQDAGRGVRASRLQVLRQEEELESGPEQPQHDGGQRNHVSVNYPTK